MKVEKQGDSECLLATMAALRGVSLESVRKRACDIACTDSWTSIVKKRTYVCINGKTESLFWATIAILAKEMNLPVDKLQSTTDHLIEVTSQEAGYLPLPEGKRGIINIQITRPSGAISYHISPFENGRLYDSGAWSNPSVMITGETLSEYIKRWESDGIIKICNINVIE